MPYHRVFGLTLHSDLSIPGLPECHDRLTDISVRLDNTSGRRELVQSGDVTSTSIVFSRNGSGTQIDFRDGSRFFIGHSLDMIVGSWPTPLTLEDGATYLLGPVMRVLLRLRRRVSLHAGAVETPYGAALFAGPAGAGKSTIVAAFAQSGFPVVTDDIALLGDEPGGGFHVVPGLPTVRLWPDSVAALWGRCDALPLLTPNWEKRYLDASTHPGCAFRDKAVPLAAVYLVRPESEGAVAAVPRIEPATPSESLPHLHADANPSAFPDRTSIERDWRFLSNVLATVSCRWLIRPRRTTAREEVVAAVMHDLGELRRANRC